MSEPQDWPERIGDRNHPFGDVPPGTMMCAYCAAANQNAAWPFRVINPDVPTQRAEMLPGHNHALLAAAFHGMVIEDASGYRARFVLAVSNINGTSVCSAHLLDTLPHLKR